MEHSDPQNQLHGHGVHLCFGVGHPDRAGKPARMATGELLGTSNPQKEATRTLPHRWQSRGKIESCLPNDTKLRISTGASDQVQCSTGRCATILPTQCCPQDGWMLVQCVQIDLPESSLARAHSKNPGDLNKSSQTDWSSFWEIQCMIQTLRCRGGTLNSFCNIWDGYKRVRNLHGGRTTRRTD